MNNKNIDPLLDKVMDSIAAKECQKLIEDLKVLDAQVPTRYDGISVRFLRDCLTVAIEVNDIEIIKIYIAFVNDVLLPKQRAFQASHFYIRPMIEAISQQSKEIVELLLDSQASLEQNPRDFLYAACRTNELFFDYLIRKGMNIYDEKEALRESLRCQNNGIAKYIVDRGNVELEYCLEWSCIYKVKSMIEYLLEEKNCAINNASVYNLVETSDIENLEYFYQHGMTIEQVKNQYLENNDENLNSWIQMKTLSENLVEKKENINKRNKV